MDEEIKEMLGEEIKAGLSDLSSLETGSKEKSEAIDDLVKLYKLKIEESKAEMDYLKEIDEHERSDQTKREQLLEQVKDRYFKLGIAAAELVLPLMFYAAWMKRGFQFEKDGTYTSTTFRGLFNRFRPTKK